MWLLAIKSMLADRGKLITSLLGVTFAVVLVNLQGGLLVGLLKKASLLIDHGGADVWAGHRHMNNVDMGNFIPERWVDRVRAVDGVERADPYLIAGGQARSSAVSMSEMRAVARQWIEALNVKAINADARVIELSGGNQQKIVVAKALVQKPRLIIFDEPTRGVDVGAKAEIYALIERFAEAGAGILIASSDVTELLGMCDRILVFHEGRLVEDFPRGEATEEAIVRAATMAPKIPVRASPLATGAHAP